MGPLILIKFYLKGSGSVISGTKPYAYHASRRGNKRRAKPSEERCALDHNKMIYAWAIELHFGKNSKKY